MDTKSALTKPTRPCPICGSTDWWWRQNNWAPKGEWLCNRCHPNPNKEAEMPTGKGKCKHGEFVLLQGCPQCIAEKQAGLEPAPELIGAQLAEESGIVEAEEGGEPYRAPYNASYHAPYRLQDGAIVPGVTTVLNILDKPGLPHWSWDLGRQGLDYREVRDAAARVGTFTHQLIACHLQGKAVDSLFLICSQEEREKALRCFEKYLAWGKENPLTPVIIETPFVSEEFKYGGTPDLLAEINGEFVLIDFKTGNGIYASYFAQLAAYRHLLEEQGWPVAGAWVVRISPDDSQVEVAIALDHDRHFEKFKHTLAIWQLDNGGEGMPKVMDLGFCPRCKEDISQMMTRVKWGIKWCWLCSFDLEESPSEREGWIRWAKEYDKEMLGR